MPPVPPGAGWVTYVRCHDDIGWAITEEDAGAVGEDGFLHRRFLADFYAGDFPGSFARGARFQADPRTGEARTSGTAASLAGLEAALERGDALAEELAIRRILLLHALAFAHGGLPLIYMGDELGLRNDHDVGDDPAQPRRQPLDAPPADGLGGGRAPPATRRRSRGGCGPGCGGWSPPAARPAPCTPRAAASRSGPATSTSSGSCASTPASGCSCSRTSPPTRSRVHLAVAHAPRLQLDPDAAAPDGRPLEIDGDILLVSPTSTLGCEARSS